MTAEASAARPAAALPAVSLIGRRILFAALVLSTIGAMLLLTARMLAPGGFSVTDIVLLALFAVTLPWTVIGFWNAIIGLIVMRCAKDPVAAVLPAVERFSGNETIAASTAILLCIRNERPDRAIRNLGPLLGGLVEAGVGDHFHVYVLSDSSDPAIAAEEEERFDSLAAAWRDRIAITYRRRASNEGFKAGNIADFCKRWGDRHDFAVTLDADSLMPAQAVMRLVRLIASDPKIGILQGLVVGLPSTSAFARLFQFGMRLGMRSYTIGSAWWQGDCGPYWGHNAVLRLRPFIAHCELSALPDGGPLAGHVLSHDQIEAVLMRRAKYEVRVLPEEDLGWEENPPTLLEFIRRDLRWCQGNMQYWDFIGLPGLHPVSRYQLAFAILMFLGSPAWIAMFVLGMLALACAAEPAAVIHAGAGYVWFLSLLAMWFAPPIATAIDVLLHPRERRSFGGPWRFAASVIAMLGFNLLLAPVMWLAHTISLAGLVFGREPAWGGQRRDEHAVPLSLAMCRLWPQTLLGWAAIAIVGLTHPEALPYVLVLAAGLVLAVPLAVVTARPGFGRLLMRLGLGRLPEEVAPPAALRQVALAALGSGSAPGVTSPSSSAGFSECSRVSDP
ncbi:MAG: glucans biosynthesis glucosyltransferase MdoH [Xanthobacteraceae bacterium]